jgi:hypothetical protein
MDFTLALATHEGLSGFAVCFVKKEIELAIEGIGIQLVIPSLLFANTKPLDDALVFLRR